MSTSSRIEWTERTWNPITGCTKISPGCKHCYAETMARRLRAIGVPGYEHDFTRVQLLKARLSEPRKRSRPTIYFVNSMSDLFHEQVPESFIDRVFEVMAACPHHTFQVLTKRADRLMAYTAETSVISNVWLGVSVENRKHGIPRIDALRQSRASVRFLSIEPLLEDLGVLDLTSIDWVIVGGESGHGARQMKPEWVASIRDQCAAQGCSFFFKQWGAIGPDGVRRSKKENGRSLDHAEWNEMPALR
jgi:protein gp37